MAERLRDIKGRFCRKPTPLPLDPALVKQLGQHRRAVELTDLGRYALVVVSKEYYPCDPEDER